MDLKDILKNYNNKYATNFKKNINNMQSRGKFSKKIVVSYEDSDYVMEGEKK